MIRLRKVFQLVRMSAMLVPTRGMGYHARGPKITAFQIMMLSGFGLPLIPIGGSDDRRLKSRMSRRLDAVDYKR